MKANYRRNSPSKQFVRRVWGTALILIVLLLLVSVPLRNLASHGYSAIQKFSYWLFESENTIPDYFRRHDALLEEIASLKAQVQAQSGNAHTISLLEQELQQLQELLQGTTSDRIGASVIARPPQVPYDVLMLDQGQQAGIEQGAVVYAGRDQVIGTVSAVYPESALVELVTSPNRESTAYVLGPDVYVTAIGMGGGVLQVQVPQGIDIQRGNAVVLPSLGSGTYGAISEVVSVPTEPVQYGFVVPGIPLQGLRLVTVGKPLPTIPDFDTVAAAVASATAPMLVVDIPEELQVATSSTPAGATSTDAIDGV